MRKTIELFEFFGFYASMFFFVSDLRFVHDSNHKLD